MAAVATTASIVTCGHGGTVATVGAPKLTVDGAPVLVAAGVAGKTVNTCGTPVVASPPAATPSKPCITVMTVTPSPSLATKLFVGGAPVVLASLAGTTDGVVSGVTPQTLLKATVTQTHLTST